jgi:hypothetical protein
MEVAVLSIIGGALVLMVFGICLAALDVERETRKRDRGDAYRLRSDSIRKPEGSSSARE